jgi:hypothetical protein
VLFTPVCFPTHMRLLLQSKRFLAYNTAFSAQCVVDSKSPFVDTRSTKFSVSLCREELDRAHATSQTLNPLKILGYFWVWGLGLLEISDEFLEPSVGTVGEHKKRLRVANSSVL